MMIKNIDDDDNDNSTNTCATHITYGSDNDGNEIMTIITIK